MSNLKFIQVGDSFNAIGLNVVWVIIGLITIYAGIKNLLDKGRCQVVVEFFVDRSQLKMFLLNMPWSVPYLFSRT